jgi:23S rRNA (guanosine2251-2'-O)-methyltransferase
MTQSHVFGFHPVREALRHRPEAVDCVLVSARRGGRRREEILALAARREVRSMEVPEHELDHVARGGRHHGFAARLRARAGEERTGDAELVVLAEDVQDPRNLGALLRVCEGAGVGRVLIRDRGSAPLGAVAAKTSAGAAEWISAERITNSGQELESLKRQGYWIYGADAAGEPPWELDLGGRVVLCIGGEEKGLRARTRSLCDAMVGLPMRGRVASLNLATAAAAILYEAVRQRGSSTEEDSDRPRAD